jgi:acyl transferase domain-containing protein
LSKTLLFEYETIHDLAAYMIRNHEVGLRTMFGTVPTVMAATHPTDLPAPGGPKSQILSAKLVDSVVPRIGKRQKCVSTSNVAVATGCTVPGFKTTNQSDDGIAIIALSGIYPGAKNLDEFWHNLKSGKNCVTEIPKNRWSVDEFYNPDPEKADQGKMYCKWGAFLDDVEMFDPLFFNISPNEAELMDPQERMFLETAWRTLEDAGYTPGQIREYIEKKNSADVGVFVGVTTNTYLLNGPNYWKHGKMPIPVSFPWSVANRVSYLFNFHGPSMPVDTACASSLTAVHMACESIRNGECAMAIAGGVNLYLHPAKYIWLCQMRMLSSKGRCASFGDGADGFVPGEGVGAVLLKPLEAAIRDRDNIYAVIRGSAVNHGGMVYGYTVPNPNAQAQLITQALKKARIDPRTIGYIETHGTGTDLGDPVEITGLTKAFAQSAGQDHKWPIGSLKSNIGHLEATAGIAGLTKVLLQMKYKQLVPSLHAERLNPNIDFDKAPFVVQRKLTSWNKPAANENEQQLEIPRRAGISSFGAGGINAHVVLEEYEYPEEKREQVTIVPSRQLVVLSAKNEQRLKVYAKDLSSFLKTNASDPKRHLSIENIAYTLQVGREPMDARLAVIAESSDDLYRQLDIFLGADSDSISPETVYTNLNGASSNDLFEDFTKGQFGRDFIGLVAAHRDLGKLALSWVSGADIPWERIHKGGHVRRVSLPTYPFDRQRYWIGGTSAFSEPHEVKKHHNSGIAMHPEEKADSQVSTPDPMRQILIQWISELLKIPENTIEEGRSLREYGFNSLAGMRLIHRIAERFDVKIPPSKLFEHQTVVALTEFLSTEMDITDRSAPQTIDSTSEAIADQRIRENIVGDIDVDRLTDGQVDELIAKLLKPSSEHSAAVSNRPDNANAPPEQLRA